MDFDALNALKYGELLKMAKDKLNITKRLSRETLIEKLLEFHKNLLDDKEYVSPDESVDKSEPEGKQVDSDAKRTVKKGKGRKKMTKKAKKEETKLNETFSMDEEEAELPQVEAPAPEPEKPAKRKREKRNLSKKEDTKEPEEVKVDPSIENNMTDISMPSEEEARAQEPPKKRVKARARKTSKKDAATKQEPVVEQGEPEGSLQGSTNRIERKQIVEEAKEEPKVVKEKEQAPQKRGRSSRGSVGNQEPEPEKPPVNKRLKKSSSFTISPSVATTEAPAVSKTEEKRKTPLPSKPSRLPRKSINFATPAKPAATPASVKKQAPTNIPRVKPPPNFAELHQKQFDRMQSVDDYLEKKRARTEATKTPAKAPLSNATAKTSTPAVPTKTPGKDIKFNFVSGLVKPVFTAKGQVASEKQRVMATVKENVLNSSMRTGSLLNVSRDLNASKMSINGKEILRGVRTNRRFELQMQHRNMKH